MICTSKSLFLHIFICGKSIKSWITTSWVPILKLHSSYTTHHSCLSMDSSTHRNCRCKNRLNGKGGKQQIRTLLKFVVKEQLAEKNYFCNKNSTCSPHTDVLHPEVDGISCLKTEHFNLNSHFKRNSINTWAYVPSVAVVVSTTNN